MWGGKTNSMAQLLQETRVLRGGLLLLALIVHFLLSTVGVNAADHWSGEPPLEPAASGVKIVAIQLDALRLGDWRNRQPDRSRT